MKPVILRRLGGTIDPSLCPGGHTCPDILELESGDFVVIGTDITAELASGLPAGSGCGPDERIVRIPRQTLVGARPDIPLTA